MRSIIFSILIMFAFQQIALPASVGEAALGLCHGKEAALNQAATKVKLAQKQNAPSSGYEKATVPAKDMLTTGTSLTQNLQSPNFVFSEFRLASEIFIGSITSLSLQSRATPVDHPPQIFLA